VPAAVDDEVLVDLVGDHDQVVLDRDGGDGAQLGVGQNGAGRLCGELTSSTVVRGDRARSSSAS
jgi:hypothetical protein